jgi:hypothetical protein
MVLECLHTQAAKKSTIARPKLVVGIMVDQMRWDYLYRYYDRYSDGGFKRLMGEGFNCENALINYLPSFTAPGHACVYTGSVPAIHGIAANDWFDAKTGEVMYCVKDRVVGSVGGGQVAGRRSPRNLLATTVTDELRLATNMRSRVFGVSIKDRASILPAGHLANGAYWFDDSTGNFITSTYYANSLPEWLKELNNKRYADSIVQQDWELLYPAATYTQSLPDSNGYEGKFAGETAPVFPRSVKGVKGLGYQGMRFMPGGNTMVTRLAKACLKNENLGKSDFTDFLCVSYSSPDYAGHMFGPNAMEIEDMILRLDLEIESLLNYLDENVGKGEYTVFFTSDHGVAHNPDYLKDIKIPAGNQYEFPLRTILNTHLQKHFGTDSLVKMMYNYQVSFNEKLILEKKLDRAEVRNATINWLKEQEGIAYVADLENMANSVIPEPIRTMTANGYHSGRSGSLQLIYEPGWLSDGVNIGTTHGTWNPYDAHIPLLWYGWGIKKGTSYRSVNMTDIAPTLAALLHIQMPNGNIGNVITEVIK